LTYVQKAVPWFLSPFLSPFITPYALRLEPSIYVARRRAENNPDKIGTERLSDTLFGEILHHLFLDQSHK
jgi:hypothetical protein